LKVSRIIYSSSQEAYENNIEFLMRRLNWNFFNAAAEAKRIRRIEKSREKIRNKKNGKEKK